MGGNYSNSEYYDMLMALGASNNRAGQAARLYAERYPQRRLPDANVLRRLEDRILFNGSVAVQPRINAGRQRVHDNEVLQMIGNDRTRSTRCIGRELIRNHVRVWRNLRRDHQHPYHYTSVQHLLENDFATRRRFCEWFRNQYEQNVNFPDLILWTDECLFTRDGSFNVHNEHIWHNQNPHSTRVRNHQYRFSVNVWGGLLGDRLVRKLIILFLYFSFHFLFFFSF